MMRVYLYIYNIYIYKVPSLWMKVMKWTCLFFCLGKKRNNEKIISLLLFGGRMCG